MHKSYLIFMPITSVLIGRFTDNMIRFIRAKIVFFVEINLFAVLIDGPFIQLATVSDGISAWESEL